jgi:hypothetical protein
MYSRSGCGRTDSDRHAGRVRLIGHGLHQEFDRLAHRELLFLRRPCSLRDLLAVGPGHVDVGQHLLDRVVAFEAQGELVAIARRRLGLGRLLRWLHLEAFEIGRAQGRRGFRIGQHDGRQRSRGRRWQRRKGWRKSGDLRIRPVREHQAAERERDDAGGKKDRPEQRKSQAFGGFRPARRRGEIRHDH